VNYYVDLVSNFISQICIKIAVLCGLYGILVSKFITYRQDIKEEMLRLAGQQERLVEVVEHSDALMSLGGVGCLLRTTPVIFN